MGYNSPFVARDRQFSEVQIPIRELSGFGGKVIHAIDAVFLRK